MKDQIRLWLSLGASSKFYPESLWSLKQVIETSAYGINHLCDMQIQAFTNEGQWVYVARTVGIQIYVLTAME